MQLVSYAVVAIHFYKTLWYSENAKEPSMWLHSVMWIKSIIILSFYVSLSFHIYIYIHFTPLTLRVSPIWIQLAQFIVSKGKILITFSYKSHGHISYIFAMYWGSQTIIFLLFLVILLFYKLFYNHVIYIIIKYHKHTICVLY